MNEPRYRGFVPTQDSLGMSMRTTADTKLFGLVIVDNIIRPQRILIDILYPLVDSQTSYHGLGIGIVKDTINSPRNFDRRSINGRRALIDNNPRSCATTETGSHGCFDRF